MSDIRSDSFVTQLKRTATSTSTFVASTLLPDTSYNVTIRKVSVANLTSAGTVVVLGVRVGSSDIYLKTVPLTTADTYYLSVLNIVVPSDYRFICKCITPTSGDKYIITLYGTREFAVE